MPRINEMQWKGLTIEPVAATTAIGDARAMEKALDAVPLTYVVDVQTTPRIGLLVIGRVKTAVFYLREADAEKARQAITEAGYGRRVVRPPPDEAHHSGELP